MKDAKKIEELLTRGVAEIIDAEHLKARLESTDTLMVKLGIDPTSPDLHLGRSIPLLKLRDFQDLGHKVVLIVGNATGVIGDTSDKESERPMLTPTDVEINMKAYTEQAGKILDMDKVGVRYNADWLDPLGYKEIGEHANAFSLHEFIVRDNIKRRLDEGKRVSLREVLYPLMQGYDSVAIGADVELGGTDQRFNMLAGRTLQPQFGQEPQDIVMNELINGTDGRKMSSSWGNTIAFGDTPEDMMNKIMNMPDDLIETYFTHCTRVPLEGVEEICAVQDQRRAKTELVYAIVSMYHDENSGAEMKQRAITQFVDKTDDREYPQVNAKEGENIVDVVATVDGVESKGDARRKIEQGGVSIDGEKVEDSAMMITKNHHEKILKIGKKTFVKIIVG